jgi:hypothetical protein
MLANRSMREVELAEMLLAEPIRDAILMMTTRKATGQILLNFNAGKIQSFELKEHTRL